MPKKLLLFSVLILISCLFLSACDKKDIDLTDIKKPDGITISSNASKEYLDIIGKEYIEAKKGNDPAAKDKTYRQMVAYSEQTTVNLEDSELKEALLNAVATAKGRKSTKIQNRFANMLSFTLGFEYNQQNNSDAKQGYINSITIYEDGTTLVPIHSEDSATKAVIIQITLPKQLVDDLAAYYSTKIQLK